MLVRYIRRLITCSLSLSLSSTRRGPWTYAETTFSNEYFRLLLEEKWTPKSKKHEEGGCPWKGPMQYENPKGDLMMLPSDIVLTQDPKFKEYVVAYAKDEEQFFKDFASAFGTLLELGCPFPKAGGGGGDGGGGGGILGTIKGLIGM